MRARLKRKEGGFDEKTFVIWLTADGRDAELDDKLGENWALAEALTVATGGPKEVRRASERAKKALREAEGQGESDEEAVPGPESKEEFERRVGVRVQKYEDAFTEIAPNDQALIRSLALTEISIDQINGLLQDEYMQAAPNADRVQKYMSALANANANASAIQKMLGIDRLTRDKAKEDASDFEKVMQVIDEAGEFMESNAVRVEHCGIVLGYYLTDFREIGSKIWVEKCPKCGKPVEVVHMPNANDLRALEPDWIKPEEARYGFAYKTEDE